MGYIEDLRAMIGHKRILLPGCCIFIENALGQILMQQRAYPRGIWGLPGGLMELGESTEETIRREVHEETGLCIGALSLFGVYSGGSNYSCIAQNGDEYDVLITVYTTNEYMGDLSVCDDESLAFEWFDPGKLPTPIARTHQELINDYLLRGAM